MKKLLCLFLLVTCCLALASCVDISSLLGQSKTCTTHIDNNGDLKCDVCSTEVECTSHKDKNEDLKCDKCGKTVTCTHKDSDNDGNCDIDACDHVFCEHEYEEEYSHNKTHHYFLPTCGCNTDPKDNAPHEDKNNDSVCDVCEWDYNHKHVYQSTYTHDNEYHWYAPTCGHDVKSGYSKHEDKARDGICDTCGWNYDHEHEYEKEWSIDKDKHWHAVSCDHLIDVKDEGNHIDINNDSVCDVCEWDYDHEHEYAKDNVWTSDQTNHWHAPTCGHDVPGIDVESHADLDENGECDACEYNVCGPNHRIDETKWGYNEEKHWQPSICGHDTPNCTMEAQGHQWNDEGTVCTMCNYNNGHVHEFDENVWESNAEGHWHRYTCHSNYTSEIAGHVDEEGNDGICDVCEYQFCNHEFDDTKWVYEDGGTTHWHTTVCSHTVENNKKDEAEHVDVEGNDGICDVCSYQMCKHPQSTTEYSHDSTHHWFAFTDCEHVVPEEVKTLHTDCDENNDGICDDCLYQFCTHPQSTTEYSNDLTHHWFAFTDCEHVVPEDRKEAHLDDDNDGVCEVCGVYCTHTYDEENWSSDENNHYHAVTCGHNVQDKDISAHVDEVGNDGICDVCSYVMCHHTWNEGDNWTSDENNHWHAVTCGHSVEAKDIAAHVDVEGNDGICDVCSYQMCNHPQSTTEYSHDSTHHWFKFTDCEHVVPADRKEEHYDPDGDGFCTICNVQYCNHTYDTESYVTDGTHHWHATTCGHPVPESTKQEHVDTDNVGFCTVCETQFCNHTYAEGWSADATYHWHAVTCGHNVEPEKIAHTDKDNDNKCDVCESACFLDGNLDVDTSNPIETPPFVVTPKQEGEE